MRRIAVAMVDRRLKALNILADESVTFFPTYGIYHPSSDAWELSIHGRIYDLETRSRLRNLTLRILCHLLGITKEQVATEMFQLRSRPFLVGGGRGKRLSVRIGERTFPLERSSSSGHFRGSLTLPREELEAVLGEGAVHGRWLPYAAITRPDDIRTFAGQIQLIPRSGLSVVSDIDDTIKHSVVAKRRALVTNTFLKDFEPVPGMADVYQKWADSGACFHYVSASPWQLYEPLSAFFAACGFPSGSFHLKLFRWRNTGFLRLFSSPRTIKLRAIRPIMHAFPERRFVFVGDSGQRDPEIYGAFARKFPRQLGVIYIRNVTAEKGDNRRFQRAFRGLPRETWKVFDDPQELPIDLAGNLPPPLKQPR